MQSDQSIPEKVCAKLLWQPALQLKQQQNARYIEKQIAADVDKLFSVKHDIPEVKGADCAAASFCAHRESVLKHHP